MGSIPVRELRSHKLRGKQPKKNNPHTSLTCSTSSRSQQGPSERGAIWDCDQHPLWAREGRVGGSKNASALNSAGANRRLGGEWAASAGRPPEEDTRGINQGIRREAGQARGHQEERQRSKQPGRCPLMPEAGGELPRRRRRQTHGLSLHV